MKEKFLNHLKEFRISANSRILVAVSGGMDSVALLHLLQHNNQEIGVAHANFQLRGQESDQDGLFVKALAERCKAPFYSKRFNTEALAVSKGISLQMAARKLRYKWFAELSEKHQWDYVATAHHMDDQIETFFINLLRGTGISGLKGIPVRSSNIIRPLLKFYKTEIEEYVKANRLDFREDSSNLKTEYLRNRIRHQLVPLLDEMQPAFRKIMAGNISHLTSAESLLRERIDALANEIVKKSENDMLVRIPALLESRHADLLLHEILQPLGFSTDQVAQITQGIDSQPGKTFFSHSHRLVIDRDQMIVEAMNNSGDQHEEYLIETDTREVLAPLHLQFKIQPRDIDFHPVADPCMAFLDAGKINFPLKIRKWRQGDRFKPLGMKGHMKLSDFFTANKFSIPEKERTWLLADAEDQIIWIVGHRIADPFRIKPATKSVLIIKWLY